MTATVADAAVISIEEAVVAIVRAATSPRLQAQLAADAGVAVERAGYGVLRALDEDGPIPVTSLARQLGVDASTVSRQVSALERAGMVGRAEDPADRRVALLALTPAGRHALERLRTARHRLFADVLSQWPASERETLAPLLARFAADLADTGAQP